MKMDDFKKEEKQPLLLALKFGIVWFIINILFLVGTYFIIPSFLGTVAYGTVTFILGVALFFYFILKIREEIGRYWSFKTAFMTIFSLCFVSGLFFYLFELGFAALVPKFKTIYINNSVESAMNMMSKLSSDAINLDKQYDNLVTSTSTMFDFTAYNLFTWLVTSVLAYAVVGLIFGAIFKREKPIFDVYQEKQEEY